MGWLTGSTHVSYWIPNWIRPLCALVLIAFFLVLGIRVAIGLWRGGWDDG